MAYKDFANDLNKGITRDVLLFYGAEDFLMNWAQDKIIEKYVSEDARDLDVIYLDGEQLTAHDIMAEAASYSMFSEKRVVVVRNYLPLYRKVEDEGADRLLEFAGKNQESSVTVFVVESRYSASLSAFGKKLAKECSAYEFARLDKPDLSAFITRRVHAAGKIIGRRELNHMIDVSGYYNRDSEYNLTFLDRDVEKIIKASSEDEISTALIEDILIGDSDRFAFNLIDALTNSNRGKALEVAEAIICHDDGSMGMLALLTKQFEIMYDSLELSEKGCSMSAMAKMTGVNEFRFKRAYAAANRYSKSRISRIVIDLYNMDRDIKRGDIDDDTALELIAISACPS